MKRISVLAAVVISALTMTAAVGTAIAAATGTALCGKAVVFNCEPALQKPAGSYFGVDTNGTGEYLKIQPNSGPPLVCQSAAFVTRSTASTGQPLPATTENWVNQCEVEYNSSEQYSCQEAVIGRPKASLEATGGYGRGTVYLGSVTEPLTLKVRCTRNTTTIACSYKASGAIPMEMRFGAGMTIADEALVSGSPMTSKYEGGPSNGCGTEKATLVLHGSHNPELGNYMSWVP